MSHERGSRVSVLRLNLRLREHALSKDKKNILTNIRSKSILILRFDAVLDDFLYLRIQQSFSYKESVTSLNHFIFSFKQEEKQLNQRGFRQWQITLEIIQLSSDTC